MFDLDAHKQWILKAIDSCNTFEQLDSSKVLISLFVLQMAKEKFDMLTIRLVEDDLLKRWIDKYSILMVP